MVPEDPEIDEHSVHNIPPDPALRIFVVPETSTFEEPDIQTLIVPASIIVLEMIEALLEFNILKLAATELLSVDNREEHDDPLDIFILLIFDPVKVQLVKLIIDPLDALTPCDEELLIVEFLTLRIEESVNVIPTPFIDPLKSDEFISTMDDLSITAPPLTEFIIIDSLTLTKLESINKELVAVLFLQQPLIFILDALTTDVLFTLNPEPLANEKFVDCAKR